VYKKWWCTLCTESSSVVTVTDRQCGCVSFETPRLRRPYGGWMSLEERPRYGETETEWEFVLYWLHQFQVNSLPANVTQIATNNNRGVRAARRTRTDIAHSLLIIQSVAVTSQFRPHQHPHVCGWNWWRAEKFRFMRNFADTSWHWFANLTVFV